MASGPCRFWSKGTLGVTLTYCTKRGLFGAKRKTLCGVADYLHRNRARMRYDEYLAQG